MRFTDAICGFVRRYSLFIIVAHVVLTLVFGYFIFSIDSGVTVERYLVKDHPSKIYYDSFVDTFRQGDRLIVVVKDDNVFDTGTMAKVEKITAELMQLKGVEEVLSLSTIMDLKRQEMKSRLQFRFISGKKKEKILRDEVMKTPLFVGSVINPDATVTAITALTLECEKDMPARVSEIIGRYQGPEEVYQVGIPVVNHVLGRTLLKELAVLTPISTLVFVVVLFICLRTKRGAILPVMAVLVSTVWTMGLMSILGIPLSLMSMILPVLMVAIGNAYAMHLVAEYFDHARQGGGRDEVITSTMSKLILPVMLTAGTTIIGFASLQFTGIQSVEEFSYLSCFGLCTSLLVTLTLIPAILFRLKLPRFKEKPIDDAGAERTRGSWIDFVIGRVINIDHKHSSAVFTVTGIICVLSVIGISMVRIETDVIKFFKPGSKVVRDLDDADRNLSGSTIMNVVVSAGREGHFKTMEGLKTIERLQKIIDDKSIFPKMGKSVSLVDLIKTTHLTGSNFRKDGYRLPGKESEINNLLMPYYYEGGKDSLKGFVTPDFSQINILCTSSYHGGKEITAVEKKLNELFEKDFPRDLNLNVTGLPLVVAHSAKLVTEGQIKSLSFALISIFIIMSVLFTSIRVGLLSMVPNMLPILINFGIMGWFGIPLSSVTSLLASIAIGISVDDTIHYMARYNSEFKKDWDKNRAMKDTLHSAGKPIVFTSIILSLVFSTMMISGFQPTMMFGLLIMITMVTALVSNVLVLPILMMKIELITFWDLVSLKLGAEPEKTMDLFKGFKRRQVKKVLVAGIMKKFKAGDQIFREGDVSSDMYAVLEGHVDVSKISAGARQKVAELNRGEVFGEMALMTEEKRSATVTATADTELLVINEKTLARLSSRYPWIASKFYHNITRVLSLRLRKTTDDYMNALGTGDQ
jgi:uncharacterized protein